MESFVGELADNGVELLEVEALVAGGPVVDVSAVDEFQQVVVVDGVVDLLGNHLELLEVDGSVLVLVEKGEHSPQTVLGLRLAHLRGDCVDEFVEADGFVLLLQAFDEFQHEGVSPVETELFQDLVDLDGIDSSTAVLIEDVESVLQLIPVLSVQAFFPGGGDRLDDLSGVGGGFGVGGGGGGLGSAHNI